MFFDRVNELLKLRSDNPAQIHSGTIGSDNTSTIWVLGLTLPNRHVTTVHARVANDDDYYSEKTAIDVAQRLHTWVETKDRGANVAAQTSEVEEKVAKDIQEAQDQVAHAATMLVSAADVGSQKVTIDREDWDQFMEDYNKWSDAGKNLMRVVRGGRLPGR
jgi:hypothetical protein